MPTDQSIGKNWTSGKLILLTILPAVAVSAITMALIPYYEKSYNLSVVEYRLIWEAIRNLFNVALAALFIASGAYYIARRALKKENFRFGLFAGHFFISLALVNFSYYPTIVLYDFAAAVIQSLPAGMGFEQLKK